MNYERKSKFTMWYKVKELTEQGLNKSQIQRETSLDRATIRKYQQMDEASFHSWITNKSNLPKKLSQYRQFVKELLERVPYLSAAQVEDRLKEHFDELPVIHSKTVFNFVQVLRNDYAIAKPSKESTRLFQKLPETDYGAEAQVDFGQTWMQTGQGKRVKIYFFAMSLSRSRYKFIYLIDQPFTSKQAVTAHYLAFDYFTGLPKKIVYDQDSIFMHNENLGDYLLTAEFTAFCKTQDFTAVFCRKADPQSKGKIESVVKYVKQNFLRGRDYSGIENLNQQALQWLERTANAKKHAGTQLIPKQEWEVEKPYLLPIKQKQHEVALSSYKVRKDHTVLYRGNFYSLPLGVYASRDSRILLSITCEQMSVYSLENDFICTHTLSLDKGKTIRNSEHDRPDSQTLQRLSEQVSELLGSGELAQTWMQLLQKNKSRYYRDNLEYLAKKYPPCSEQLRDQCLLFCIENKVFNGKNLIDMLKQNQHLTSQLSKNLDEASPPPIPPPMLTETLLRADTSIQTSDINTYETLFN
ncbi:MAG: IS21 family transposase [Bacteroidetes bacterium]|nr:IS21 family transposase [Bacteroidota bacterium]